MRARITAKVDKESFANNRPSQRKSVGGKRLALTPETTALLVEEGHRVFMEKGAGQGINYPDHSYADSGAEIVDTHSEIMQADLIIKISPPSLEEVEMMKPRTTVFSFLQLHQLTKSTLELMSEKE